MKACIRAVHPVKDFKIVETEGKTFVSVFLQGVQLIFKVNNGCSPTNIKLVLEYDEVISA